jgi:hypothetical protein
MKKDCANCGQTAGCTEQDHACDSPGGKYWTPKRPRKILRNGGTSTNTASHAIAELLKQWRDEVAPDVSIYDGAAQFWQWVQQRQA